MPCFYTFTSFKSQIFLSNPINPKTRTLCFKPDKPEPEVWCKIQTRSNPNPNVWEIKNPNPKNSEPDPTLLCMKKPIMKRCNGRVLIHLCSIIRRLISKVLCNTFYRNIEYNLIECLYIVPDGLGRP